MEPEKTEERSPLDTPLNYNELQKELMDHMEIKEVELTTHNFTSLEVALMKLVIGEKIQTIDEPRFNMLRSSLVGITLKLSQLRCEF